MRMQCKFLSGISPNFFPPPDYSGEMPAEEARTDVGFLTVLTRKRDSFVELITDL
jgi:hypothetical protein